MKKHFAAVCAIILFTFFNSLYYIVGLSKAPAGTVFTGAVRYAPDYYFYLSFISQGQTRWLSSYHLFTGETTIPTFIGWFYTLAGHVLFPLHLTATTIYIALTVLMSVIYLTVAYLFIKMIIPNNPLSQIAIFIIFVTANSMPQITKVNGVWMYHYTAWWYNYGDPFERLTYIPHHLLFEAAAIAAIAIGAHWWQTYRHRWVVIAAMAILGFILSSTQPALWMVIVISLGIGALWKPKNLILSLLPAIVLGISGLPFVLYLKYYVYTLPIFQNQYIEASWASPANVWDYVVLNGPIFIAMILGLPVWLASMTRQKMALTVATCVSLILYFSPAGPVLQILNIRFLSVIPTLFMACVTGFWFMNLAKMYPRAKPAILAVLSVLVLSTIPLAMQESQDRDALFIPTNQILYPQKTVLAAFQKAEAISNMYDIFLVPSPYDTSFSGLTGRRIFVYPASPSWTLNFENKHKAALAFYGGSMTEDQRRLFLQTNHIAYVLNLTHDPVPYSGLIQVYANDYMAIYKVPQGK